MRAIAVLGGDSQVREKADSSFQVFATSAGTPYQNVHYEVLNNDGTYANVKITAQFRLSESSDWTEHETTIQCRKVGNEWQCDSIFTMDFSQAEKQKQLATQEAAIASATQFWQNIQDAIKVEITGSPSLGQPYNDYGVTRRDLIANVKVTNQDSQAHSLCIMVRVLVNLPDSVLRKGIIASTNPITWWGESWDKQKNECDFLVNGNSTETIVVEIGGGSGSHSAGDPTPMDIDNVSQATFVQSCIKVLSLDGNNTDIEWRKDPSQECGW
jgi:hypothetical protein